MGNWPPQMNLQRNLQRYEGFWKFPCRWSCRKGQDHAFPGETWNLQWQYWTVCWCHWKPGTQDGLYVQCGVAPGLVGRNYFDNGFRPNIALLELLVIVTVVETWAEKLTGKHIILQCNNSATVTFINRMKSDIPEVMDLLRLVSKTCLKFQIWLKAVHIPSNLNLNYNDISRDRLDQFFKWNPTAVQMKMPLPTSVWPPTWILTQMMTYLTLEKK